MKYAHLICIGVYLFFTTSASWAATYPLPEAGNNIVGKITHAKVLKEDTLLDIARRHDVGYNEIVAANPNVDPWLPAEGSEVVVPTQYILPNAPRDGIVINIPEMRLYFYPRPTSTEADAVVVTYPVGIGAEGNDLPLKKSYISQKTVKPTWFVPESIRKEHAADGDILPKSIPPGEDNPLGDYAMRLGRTSFLIHGTNRPYSIGMRVTHGCLRMYPEDISALFPRIAVGLPVHIVDQPYKLGVNNGEIYVEMHEPIAPMDLTQLSNLPVSLHQQAATEGIYMDYEMWDTVTQESTQNRGIPISLGQPHVINTEFKNSVAKSEGWILQVGAYGQAENIERMVLLMRNLLAPVSVVGDRKSSLCRVVSGPFPDKTRALRFQTIIASLFDIKTAVLPARKLDNATHCNLFTRPLSAQRN